MLGMLDRFKRYDEPGAGLVTLVAARKGGEK